MELTSSRELGPVRVPSVGYLLHIILSNSYFSVAERLWSPAELRDTNAATPRLNEWRCQMISRGLAAEPNVVNINIEQYHKYGYCPTPFDPFNVDFFW